MKQTIDRLIVNSPCDKPMYYYENNRETICEVFEPVEATAIIKNAMKSGKKKIPI